MRHSGAAARYGLVLALLLAPAAVGLVAAPATLGQPAPGQVAQGARDGALDRLAGCVRQRRDLDVLILMDESGSLAGTDPAGLRVRAAGVAVDGLTRLVDPANTPEPVTVEIALAGFAATVDAGPWRDLATSRDAIQADIAGFAQRQSGGATNYVEALLRARENLAAQAAARAARTGDEAPCQALIWLTDGEPAPRGTATSKEEIDQHKQELCRQGGPVDQLRTSGITLLLVGLTGRLTPADETYLRQITGEPGGCGTPQLEPPGLYVAADDQGLVEAFAGLAQDVEPVPLCRESGPCSFTLEPHVRSFVALIHSSGSGAEVLLRPPAGSEVALQRPGRSAAVTVSGANLRWNWHGDSVLVHGQLPREAAVQWRGQWLAVVREAGGRVSGGQVYLYGNLEQRILGEPRLVRGEPWRMRVEIVDVGSPEGAGLAPVDHQLSVYFADGADRRQADVGPDPAGGGTMEVTFTPPAGWHGSAVTVTVRLRVLTRDGIDISPADLTREIPVVTPLRLEPSALQLPPVHGRESTGGVLTVTAADSGGCVWLDSARIELAETPAQIAVSPDDGASSAQRCLQVGPGTSGQVRVRLTVERSWDGTVRGRLPVMMAVDGAEPIRVDVPLSVILVAKPEPSRWYIFGLLLALSGAPLLGAVVVNSLMARFVKPRTLRTAVMEFHVGGGRIEPLDGSDDWPAWSATKPVSPPPVHRFTAGPVTFRVRRLCSPFASPPVEATASDRSLLATATAGPSRVIDRLPLNLTDGIAIAVADGHEDLTTVQVVFVVGDEQFTHKYRVRLRQAAIDAIEQHLRRHSQLVASR